MKTFKLIIFAFCLFSIFNAMPVVATTTPMTDLTPAEQIYPPFLIFNEGNGNVICTTEEGIKDGMTFETKDGIYTVRGNGILGPNGWYSIDSNVRFVDTPKGYGYHWHDKEVNKYTINNNIISGPEGKFLIVYGDSVRSPKNTWSGCISK